MKYLIRSGAGFIGNHLVDKLIKQDHQAVVIDNLITGKKKNLNPRVKFYKADVGNSNISWIFAKERPKNT